MALRSRAPGPSKHPPGRGAQGRSRTATELASQRGRRIWGPGVSTASTGRAWPHRVRRALAGRHEAPEAELDAVRAARARCPRYGSRPATARVGPDAGPRPGAGPCPAGHLAAGGAPVAVLRHPHPAGAAGVADDVAAVPRQTQGRTRCRTSATTSAGADNRWVPELAAGVARAVPVQRVRAARSAFFSLIRTASLRNSACTARS